MKTQHHKLFMQKQGLEKWEHSIATDGWNMGRGLTNIDGAPYTKNYCKNCHTHRWTLTETGAVNQSLY